MKKYINVRNAFALALSFSLLSLMVSCEKENENTQPELPPLESMLMNFSAFSEQPAQAKGTEASYKNFAYSYLTVFFWNVSAAVVTITPAAAYALALDQLPVKTGDYTWQWSFDFNDNGTVYQVALEAERLNNEEFSASMMVALASAPGVQVKWFDGVVRYDGTEADWTIYKDGTAPVLEISWNKNFEAETEDLSYTYVEANMNETGSYIMWAKDSALDMDASYTVSMAAGMTNIEWNSTTIEGRVKALINFGDEDWHCWESQENGLMDKDCS